MRTYRKKIIGYALYNSFRLGIQLVAPLSEYGQLEQLLECQLVRQRQQQQRDQLEWRGVGLLSCETK